MNELLSSAFVLLLGAIAIVFATRRLTRFEQRFVVLAFVGHALASVAQVMTAQGVYQGGDNLAYMSEGSLLARAIEAYPERFGRVWLDLLLQREINEAVPLYGEGSSTGSMVAITAALALVLRYSLYGACLLATVIAFSGKLAFYRVFRELLPETLRTRVLIGVFAMPSAVFWSSGIQKEAFVVAGIGPLWLGLHRLLRGRPIRGSLLVIVGVLPIALLKPYTLFALTFAIGVWIGLDRLRVRKGATGHVRIRPFYLVLGGALAYAGFVALGYLFPKYSTENIGEDIAHHQAVGELVTETNEGPGGGASYYQMGDQSASLEKQLAFAPLAAATALFRPFPFEANNALAFAASLETFALTCVVIQLLFRVGFGRAFSSLMSRPVLAASMTFAVLFGAGVGLASANFGSLSRYRMPMIPFYATVVLVLAARSPKKVQAAAARNALTAARPMTLRASKRPSPSVR